MPLITRPAPTRSYADGVAMPSTSPVTIAPTGIRPANSPARPGPSLGSEVYQRKNATTVTTTVR